MKQSAFAELHGVSRKTVTKWKERGWLVFAGDEVDVEASNVNLKRYRRDGIGSVTQSVTQDGKVTAKRATKKSVTATDAEVTVRADETPARAAERILAATGMELDFDEARCMKENYLALLNQLEYDQKSGLVVAVADVAKAVGEEYAKVRTKLLAIPAEQAPAIHRLRTVLEVQDALQEMIVHALEELTRDGVGGTA
ncbi:hypothetical protein PPGU19_011920 [Paraburkholderia sp. PGU19]|uniref:hypothetical protein n=1 Tax=Paraburkholderia sp. PGU19 TaxID=2735434 RepID=UPI0015DAABD1|nr:hypothetical protein [Paraburkholderia sp. PGU19]BCF96623.1 hypothetical protein PPGU19_011920 [Paraburkholderia sp. PGU19]